MSCWPLSGFSSGSRRSCRSSSHQSSLAARCCFAYFLRPCARGCFAFRTVFARHGGYRLPKGTGRVGEAESDSDDERKDPSGALVGEDGVRPAMASVYIDCDVLLRSNLTSLRKHDEEPCSIVFGSEGLPNSQQPFFQARHEAAQQQMWLVVNLQHPESATCEKLNSEVWSRPEFSERIFIDKAKLWQRDVGHFQAEQFIVYYCNGQAPSAEECPLIIILDPRTGRALRRWKAGTEEYPLELNKALQLMNTFFDTHTLEGFSPPESPQHSPKMSPALGPEVRFEDFEEITLTESFLGEELAKTDDGQSSICGPFWDVVETSSSGSASPAAPFCTKDSSSSGRPSMATMTPSTTLSSAVTPRTSVSSAEATVNILLRFPDGVRLEQAFAADEPLGYVLDFAAQQLPSRSADQRPCTAADVLLEVSTPLGQESLHALPVGMPVGSLDIHRKVLNVRMRSLA